MTTAEELAARHAAAFEGESRPWSAEEFASLLASPHVHLIEAGPAFALLRIVADEAEILTLATDPDQRQRGHGMALLTAMEMKARDRSVAHLFLEVSDTNSAARALYAKAGFTETARRKAYYENKAGHRVDALILSKPLA